MAKGIYVGVDGKAHKVKKVYVGVDSKARKVKKGYIGVGGIAQQFYSSETIVTGNIIPTSWNEVTKGTSYSEKNANPPIKLVASGYTSPNIATYACDRTTSTYWGSDSSTTSWLRLEFPVGAKPKITKMAYKINHTQGVSSVKIQGSQDGSAWTSLYNKSSPSTNTLVDAKLNTNVDYYKYYRLYITGKGSGTAQVRDWEVLEYVED